MPRDPDRSDIGQRSRTPGCTLTHLWNDIDETTASHRHANFHRT